MVISSEPLARLASSQELKVRNFVLMDSTTLQYVRLRGTITGLQRKTRSEYETALLTLPLGVNDSMSLCLLVIIPLCQGVRQLRDSIGLSAQKLIRLYHGTPSQRRELGPPLETQARRPVTRLLHLFVACLPADR